MAAQVPSALRIAVVGAGPAGLCAATALAQHGHRVTVLERHPSLQSRGNALVIQPAAVKSLQHIRGAQAALRAVSVDNDELCWWRYKDENPFARNTVREARFDTDRPSVQRVFHDLALRNGVEIRFSRNVEAVIDNDRQPELLTSDGESVKADLIIGADGIKSVIRKHIFPNIETDPITLRESIFLTTIPGSRIRENQQLHGWGAQGVTHGTMGPGRFILSRWLNDDVYGIQFVDVDHSTPAPVDSNWNTPADVPALRKLFSDFNQVTRSFLQEISAAEKWQIAIGPSLESWRSDSGRVILIGDGAHAMTPHAAQGLSQGIEDGVSLATMLEYSHPEDIPRITGTWVQLRKPRADLFVQRSLTNANIRSIPDGQQQRLRDTRIVNMAQRPAAATENVAMDMNAEQHTPQFQKWMKEYDIIAESKKLRNLF